MIGRVVQVKLKSGTLLPGLVTHEWPHDENTGVDDPRKISAVVVSEDPADMVGSGRVTRVVTSLPYEPQCSGDGPCWCEWEVR